MKPHSASLALFLLASVALASYSPNFSPPSAAQRAQIDGLARSAFGKRCDGVPRHYSWTNSGGEPMPASSISDFRAEYLGGFQAGNPNNWRGKLITSKQQQVGSAVQIHHLIRFTKGRETANRYDLLIFNVVNGKITQMTNAICVLK